MPPLLWAFFILSGLAHGHTLVTNVKGVDPNVRLKTSPTPVEYRAWTAPLWAGAAREGTCRVIVYARVTGRGPMRCRLNGDEQLLDEGWSTEVDVPAGERMTMPIEFIEPVGGTVTHATQAWFRCYEPGKETRWPMP